VAGKRPKVLAVDDEEFNLDILQTDLEESGFEVVRAEDGLVALERLEEHPDTDIVVLDRMMPRMDGMEVLRRLKSEPRYRDLPVIMQTAAAQSKQVEEGIRAGAYYYLSKPYDEQMLIGIVRAALHESRNFAQMREEVRKHKNVLGLIEEARFRFRTLEEAKNVAYYVANCCPDPENTVFGLSELMVNAVEHGNLGITYEEKTRLVLDGKWEEEVRRRLLLPENSTRFATLCFENDGVSITVIISDNGEGFDWRNYIDFDPDRMTHPHGRGIAMAHSMSFAEMEYQDEGRKVICRIPVRKSH
jgi:CheY-like chemotaxis protein/anti-sigma regulatory factor (Ser/Thr protein kinase)